MAFLTIWFCLFQRGALKSTNVDQSPQMWTKVNKCGPKSTSVDHSPQLWTSVHMDHCSVNTEHVQSISLSLASIGYVAMDPWRYSLVLFIECHCLTERKWARIP